jgi:hypothetical protein
VTDRGVKLTFATLIGVGVGGGVAEAASIGPQAVHSEATTSAPAASRGAEEGIIDDPPR